MFIYFFETWALLFLIRLLIIRLRLMNDSFLFDFNGIQLIFGKRGTMNQIFTLILNCMMT